MKNCMCLVRFPAFLHIAIYHSQKRKRYCNVFYNLIIINNNVCRGTATKVRLVGLSLQPSWGYLFPLWFSKLAGWTLLAAKSGGRAFSTPWPSSAPFVSSISSQTSYLSITYLLSYLPAILCPPSILSLYWPYRGHFQVQHIHQSILFSNPQLFPPCCFLNNVNTFTSVPPVLTVITFVTFAPPDSQVLIVILLL